MLVISREDIERTGLTSIGDILQNLPQAGAALNTAFNNGGTGATEIDLRNLGSDRVLVLVNGRRWVPGLRTLTSAVDLNTIPISIIDSIEILKDGASAIYGSDAIAGVINIKTRRDFQGFEGRAHYEVLTESSTDEVTWDYNFLNATTPGQPGTPTGPVKFQDDGQGFSVNFSGGTVGRNSSLVLDVSYTRTDPVFAGSRNVPAWPTVGPQLGALPDGYAHSRGSLFGPTGNLIFVPTDNNAAAFNAGQSTGQANDPNAICYPIIDAGDTVEGETGVPLPIPPGAAGAVNLCVAASLNGRPDSHRAGRPDYGHQYVPFDYNFDGYNYAPINYLITPQERSSLFGQFSYQLNPDLRFTSELLYNNRRSEQQLAHQPLGVGDLFSGLSFGLAYVASDNPYNPTNPSSPYYVPGAQPQDIGRADPASGLIGLGAATRRMLEGGPRIFRQNVDTFRLGGGFEGQFMALDRFFSWDAGAVYTESRQTDQSLGEYNMLRVARALGPLADCIGDEAAGTPPPAAANGCVPLDIFGPIGSVTQEMLDYIQSSITDNDRSTQAFAYANFSTEFEAPGELLPAPVGVAFGAEVRREAFEANPDDDKVQGVNANLAETPTKGSYDVQEAYVEFGIPVLEGVEYADSLALSVAGRYSRYGILDRTFTNLSSKFGVEYRPDNQLLVRGTYSEAFRAPSVTDLFLGAALSFPVLNDPCSDYTNSTDPNVQQNCANDGVPDTYTQTNNQLPSTFGGNPDLEPETATTKSIGFVYSPDAIPSLGLTVDWYNVTIDDIITFPGAQTILNACYLSPPNQRQLCEFVERNPDGAIRVVRNVAANLNQLEVEGVDINVDWRLPFEALQDYGTFHLKVDGAYTTKYISTTIGLDEDGNPVKVSAALVGLNFGAGGLPRWKVNASLDWERGPWRASWATRYIHRMYAPCDDGFSDPGRAVEPGVLANPTPRLSFEEAGLCDGGERAIGNATGITSKVEAVFYHDVLVGYDFAQYDVDMVIGVRNVFNEDPPLIPIAFASSYDPTLHEFEDSRAVYLRLNKRF